jgi:DNA-binding MarR family transcriptional regulator
MRFIRHEMRTHRQAQLSVPQFRALVFLNVTDDPSLSAMAEHIGISLPAASRMVDMLVKRGLLERRVGATDRRRVSLSLTARGRKRYRRAHRETQAALARRFGVLSAAEQGLVRQAMQLLTRVFGPERASAGALRRVEARSR